MERDEFKPKGWPTVLPRIFVTDVRGLVSFLKLIFEAQGEYRREGPTELRIDDSVLMVSDGAGVRMPAPSFLYVYVRDTDSVYQRALDSGALSVEEPADMPYGDRRATIQDSWGNVWQLATRLNRD